MINLYIILFHIIIIYLLIVIFEERSPGKPGKIIPPASGDTVRNFSWEVNGLTKDYFLQCEIKIDGNTYNNAAGCLLNDNPGKIYMRSIKENFIVAEEEISHKDYGYDSSAVQQIVAYLKDFAEKEFLSTYELTNVILSFVHEQCIKYEYDLDSTGYNEYFRYPLETIYDQAGDCDCKSILSCSIFKAFDIQVAFLIMPGHAAVAITFDEPPIFSNITINGKQWFYCESTGDYWRPGQLPLGIDISSIELKELK